MRNQRKRILLIGGSLNQTTMMHAIGRRLAGHDCYYTPYYSDGLVRWLSAKGYLDFTVMGGPMRRQTEEYLAREELALDEKGTDRPYDLVVTCSDLIVQKNVRNRPLVLVQEGMTDPENLGYLLVRWLKLPRWIGSTSTNGLSLAYDRFCVASEGYRDLFVRRGVPADRIAVTGIPNFDNCAAFLENDFPYRDFVLVATSDTRETFKIDARTRFLARVKEIAAGRPVIFKIHPNERPERSIPEIRAVLPDALVYTDGNVNHMIANCQVLITQFSSCVYVGMALGKECHSNFDMDELRVLLPLQNGGTSAARIAQVCEDILCAEDARVATS